MRLCFLYEASEDRLPFVSLLYPQVFEDELLKPYMQYSTRLKRRMTRTAREAEGYVRKRNIEELSD